MNPEDVAAMCCELAESKTRIAELESEVARLKDLVERLSTDGHQYRTPEFIAFCARDSSPTMGGDR